MPKPKDDGQTYYEVPKTTKTKKPKYSQINCPELCCNAPPKTKKKVRHRHKVSYDIKYLERLSEIIGQLTNIGFNHVCGGRRKRSR